MAKKQPAKPLFAVKHDFFDSVEAVSHQAIMLIQAIEMVLARNLVEGEPAKILAERVKAFRATLVTDE